MTFLVDANVLSEATKPAPHEAVVDWLRHNEREIAVDPSFSVRFGSVFSSCRLARGGDDDWNAGFAKG